MPDKNCFKMADNINTEYLDSLGMNVIECSSVEREIFVKKFLNDEH